MQKTKKWLLPLLGLAFAGAALAQTAEPAKFYKLDFVVKELETGKVVNSRSYSTMLTLQSNDRSSIRTGSRVPVTASDGKMTYIDLGVSIDCWNLKEVQSDLSLFVSADLSSALEPSTTPNPVIRQNRWSSIVTVPAKKPTVIFSSDDVSSKRQIQLELTATPVK